jgi:hypothetical protein
MCISKKFMCSLKNAPATEPPLNIFMNESSMLVVCFFLYTFAHFKCAKGVIGGGVWSVVPSANPYSCMGKKQTYKNTYTHTQINKQTNKHTHNGVVGVTTHLCKLPLRWPTSITILNNILTQSITGKRKRKRKRISL